MNGIIMWCITYSPPGYDGLYDDLYVARKFVNDRPTNNVCTRQSIRALRRAIQEQSPTRLEPIPRSVDDEKHIIEVWAE